LSLAGCAVSGGLNDIQAINELVNVLKAKLKIIFHFEIKIDEYRDARMEDNLPRRRLLLR